jgi:hypothetical protein
LAATKWLGSIGLHRRLAQLQWSALHNPALICSTKARLQQVRETRLFDHAQGSGKPGPAIKPTYNNRTIGEIKHRARSKKTNDLAEPEYISHQGVAKGWNEGS